MQIMQLHQRILTCLDDMKANDIVSLDVKDLTTITDYMVICSGRSQRHVTAIAENLQQTMKDQGVKAIGVEGMQTGDWILVDFADVIVHVMLPEVRTFYQLEKLWGSDALATTSQQ